MTAGLLVLCVPDRVSGSWWAFSGWGWLGLAGAAGDACGRHLATGPASNPRLTSLFFWWCSGWRGVCSLVVSAGSVLCVLRCACGGVMGNKCFAGVARRPGECQCVLCSRQVCWGLEVVLALSACVFAWRCVSGAVLFACAME